MPMLLAVPSIIFIAPETSLAFRSSILLFAIVSKSDRLMVPTFPCEAEDDPFSTPAAFQFQSSAFHEYSTVKIASGAPSVAEGYMEVADTPGLGVTPDMAILREPLYTASQ